MKDFFCSDIPPGGREKDSRKNKIIEEEKIVDEASSEEKVSERAVLCRGKFLFSKF